MDRRRALAALLLPALPAAALDAPPDEAPALAAVFRVSYTPRGGATQVQTWQLQRSSGQIAWRKPALEEIWRRDPSGVALLRVLPADRATVHYSAGELRTLGVRPDWDALGCLLSPGELARLQRLPRPGTLQHWTGRLGADKVLLQWDAAARLPLRLQRRSLAGEVLYQRLALYPQAPPAWPEPGAGSQDYAALDAADFGDQADHPVVRREQARDERAGWRPQHRH